MSRDEVQTLIDEILELTNKAYCVGKFDVQMMFVLMMSCIFVMSSKDVPEKTFTLTLKTYRTLRAVVITAVPATIPKLTEFEKELGLLPEDLINKEAEWTSHLN